MSSFRQRVEGVHDGMVCVLQQLPPQVYVREEETCAATPIPWILNCLFSSTSPGLPHQMLTCFCDVLDIPADLGVFTQFGPRGQQRTVSSVPGRRADCRS